MYTVEYIKQTFTDFFASNAPIMTSYVNYILCIDFEEQCVYTENTVEKFVLWTILVIFYATKSQMQPAF